MTDQILEIIQRNYDKFTGTNEAELHAAEEIAALLKSKLEIAIVMAQKIDVDQLINDGTIDNLYSSDQILEIIQRKKA